MIKTLTKSLSTSTANVSFSHQLSSNPSKVLLVSLSLLYLVATISILFLSLNIWIKGTCIVIVLVLAIKTIKQHILFLSTNAISKINCSANRKCRIELNNGKVYQAKLMSADCLFNYFVVFTMQASAKKFSAAIAKDTMSQEKFYQLNLYLRSLNK